SRIAVAFFLVTLFLAKQKEVTGCRAAPGLVVTEYRQFHQPQADHSVQCPSVIAPYGAELVEGAHDCAPSTSFLRQASFDKLRTNGD
ncbi:hypothetical protein QN362_04075, partial [Actimicrobium sp. CCC2.4]|uniref:hypothetical protein n=1 Tax=Actimicrobium sp. CCC2.4 TaxID=3048606 RepID=UPI002B247A49